MNQDNINELKNYLNVISAGIEEIPTDILYSLFEETKSMSAKITTSIDGVEGSEETINIDLSEVTKPVLKLLRKEIKRRKNNDTANS